MNLKKQSNLIIKFLGLVLLSPLWGSSSRAAAPENLMKAMHQNLGALFVLQHQAAQSKEFNQKSDDGTGEALSRLSDSAKAMPEIFKKERPGLSAIAEVYSQYLQDISKNYEAGHRDYARLQVRTATNFCIACHSTGVSSQILSKMAPGFSPEPSSDLSAEEKAEFFAVTRQFDRALTAYEALLEKVESPSEVARLARTALSLAVRVDENPDKALAILNQIEKNKEKGAWIQSDMRQWKQDLNSWKSGLSGKDHKPARLLGDAGKLVAAGKKRQEFPADHAGDVSFLRATKMLHQALQGKLANGQKAQAYFLLGQSYTALADPLLTDLNLLYFDACVRETPHSALARQCYGAFSKQILYGYSGSAGIHLPVQETKRLNDLKALAF